MDYPGPNRDVAATRPRGPGRGVAATRPRTIQVPAAASPRIVHRPSKFWPRRRRESSTDYPSPGRGVAATLPRTLQVPAVASPRIVHGLSKSWPRRRRDPSADDSGSRPARRRPDRRAPRTVSTAASPRPRRMAALAFRETRARTGPAKRRPAARRGQSPPPRRRRDPHRWPLRLHAKPDSRDFDNSAAMSADTTSGGARVGSLTTTGSAASGTVRERAGTTTGAPPAPAAMDLCLLRSARAKGRRVTASILLGGLDRPQRARLVCGRRKLA